MKADLLSLNLINECLPYQLPFMLTFSYTLFTMVLFSFKKIAEVVPQAGVVSHHVVPCGLLPIGESLPFKIMHRE